MARDEADSLGVVLDCGDGVCPTANTSAGPAIVAPSEKVISEVCEHLKARVPAGSPIAKLENVVREVVYAKMGEGADLNTKAASAPSDSGQGIRFIDHQRLIGDDVSPITVDEKMLVAEAIGDQSEEKLAAGYLVWEKSSFTRHVEQPEIAVVVEGELHLDVDGSTLVGKPGDIIYFPKGTVVAYNAPQRVKLACVNCI
jgi:ethanolamine utilization protein EutQ